jgi:hypothetical protein
MKAKMASSVPAQPAGMRLGDSKPKSNKPACCG